MQEYDKRSRTCSRARQTLLPSPPSLKNRSNIIKGVSTPLPSRDLLLIALPPPDLNARPPRMTSVSRAFSRAFSRASPRRSTTPPAGRSAEMTCRKVALSTSVDGAVEEVEEDTEGVGRGWTPLGTGVGAGCVIRSGRRGGRAETVAAVRCWLDVRRHALSTDIRPSGSLIFKRR